MKRVLLTALVLAMALTSCATNDDDAQATITISAAASLTDAFTEIGDAFRQANPEVRIRFNFAGSSTLAAQINAGAPVDVFAAASVPSMRIALDAGSIEDPQNFAANQLAIVVPSGNPAGIIELTDLQNSELTLVTCDARVPCGAATNALFDKSGLSVNPSSLEPDVRAVLTKVIADEADAGIVYRTDVFAAGDQVEVIEIEDKNNVINTYPIALTAQAKSGSQAFVDFVLSDEGQAILRTWGFESP